MRKVVVLAEAADDIERARTFYDAQEFGMGDYCADSLVVDIERLALFHGIHACHFGFHRMLASPFSVRHLLSGSVQRNPSVRGFGFAKKPKLDS